MRPAQHDLKPECGPVTILPALGQPSLADEANHRIANNLQLLVALVSFESRRIADPDAVAAFELTIRRIGAIAGIHRHLYQASTSASVDLDIHVAELAEDLDEAAADAEGAASITVDAAAVFVSADDATAIGIIVSELVSNTRKYAAAPGTACPVRIILRRLPTGGYWLEVSDQGRGLAPGLAATGTGLGSQIIAMMARRLGAAHAWHDNAPGTCFTLHIGDG